MADFSNWCTVGTLVPIGDHQAGVLESYDDAKGVVTLAASLPNAYAESDSLAKVAERFGKEGVAKLHPARPSGVGDEGGRCTRGATRLQREATQSSRSRRPGAQR
jgi:hypothetical protein